MADVEKGTGTHKPESDGEWVRLGDVIKKAKSARCGSDSYPILSITMRDGIVEQASRFKKSIASRDTGNYKVVEPGQLVVGFPIDEGVINVQNFNYPGIMSPAYDVWDIDSSRVDPSYLELALHSPQSMDYYRSNLRGTTARRRSLPTNTLCDLTFPLPSLESQRIVVKRMSMIATLLDDAGSRLSALDDLVKSQFVEMFGDPATNSKSWKTESLTNLGSCKNGLNFKYRDNGLGISCLGVGDFKDKTVINSVNEMGFVSLDESPSDNYLLNDGDLVFVRSNGNKELVGRCVAVYPHGEKAVYSGFCIRLRLQFGYVRVPYLVHMLKQPGIRRQMFGRGANVQNLNQQLLSNIQVPLPPLTLQDQFADFVARVGKLGFDCCREIVCCGVLFSSMSASLLCT